MNYIISRSHNITRTRMFTFNRLRINYRSNISNKLSINTRVTKRNL
nr:MAG TPA: hypothetical protein [Bacteriophage sp.]